MGGADLGQLIAAGDIDPARALALLVPAADALDAAHAEGRVHGALTPSDIVVGEAGDVTVAGLDGPPGAATAPPEDDVAGLARVLHACLTGDFDPGPGPLPQVSATRPDLHPRIDWVVARGIATEPEDRQASARDLMTEAAAALDPPRRRRR